MKKTQQKNVKRTRIKPPSTAKTGSKHTGENPAENFIKETREYLFPDTGIDFLQLFLHKNQKNHRKYGNLRR